MNPYADAQRRPFASVPVMTVRRRHSYRVIAREVAPNQWEWEIVRDNRSLEIKLREGPFKSERAAMTAGRAAIREFLKLLDIEPVS